MVASGEIAVKNLRGTVEIQLIRKPEHQATKVDLFSVNPLMLSIAISSPTESSVVRSKK